MTTTKQQRAQAQGSPWGRPSAYEEWIASTGVPIHRGYFIEDARTVELGPWPERECNAAFFVLAGQELFLLVRQSCHALRYASASSQSRRLRPFRRSGCSSSVGDRNFVPMPYSSAR